jgi:hypothetical protein
VALPLLEVDLGGLRVRDDANDSGMLLQRGELILNLLAAVLILLRVPAPRRYSSNAYRHHR